MAKKKRTKANFGASPFSEEERRRFLYHTAEEMRVINDRADARFQNNVQREETTGHYQPAQDELRLE